MLSVWEYLEAKRYYPGFHIAGDNNGINSIARKLRTTKGDIINIQLSPVTKMMLRVPNNKEGKAKCKSYSRLIIEQYKTAVNRFAISSINNDVVIKASRKSINIIAKSLMETKRGEGDYFIGSPKTGCLWFWWFLK